jgi:hypothetical protein
MGCFCVGFNRERLFMRVKYYSETPDWPALLRMEVRQLYSGTWIAADSARLSGWLQRILPLAESVDARLCSALWGTAVLPFGARFVMIQRPEFAAPALLAFPTVNAETEAEFNRLLRGVIENFSVPDLPPDAGLYDRVRRLDDGPRWWPVRAAWIVDGPILLGQAVSRNFSDFAHAVVHEAAHIVLVRAGYSLSNHSRTQIERQVLETELAFNDVALSASGTSVFGTELRTELVQHQLRIREVLRTELA